MIHDAIDLPLQIPPLAGARSSAPEPTASSGEDAGAPGSGFSPVAPAGGNAIDAIAPAVFGDGAHQSAAIEAIAAERRRQIEQFGHTPEADAALPLGQLPRTAQRFLTDAIEDVQFQRGEWRANARRHLARAGAMILAAIDRIEAEPRAETFDHATLGGESL